MEAIVATVITVIAILAMAYSFSLGRAFINAFEVRRVAVARTQGVMEVLGSLPATSDSLSIGTHVSATPFAVPGVRNGMLRWSVTAATDVPASALGSLRQVAVTTAWTFSSWRDSVSYSRVVTAP